MITQTTAIRAAHQLISLMLPTADWQLAEHILAVAADAGAADATRRSASTIALRAGLVADERGDTDAFRAWQVIARAATPAIMADEAQDIVQTTLQWVGQVAKLRAKAEGLPLGFLPIEGETQMDRAESAIKAARAALEG